MKKTKKARQSALPEAPDDSIEVIEILPPEAKKPYDVEDDLSLPVVRDPEVASTLTFKVSAALLAKLRHSAQDEGISVDALVSELLAEGVALRAWEIIERKGAMRGIQPSAGTPTNGSFRGGQGGHQNQRSNGNHNPRYGQNKSGGQHRSHRQGNSGNNAWMEDRAAFLEYVRNQEKRRR